MTFVKEVKVRVAKKRGPIGIVRALEKHMDLVKPSLPAAGEYTKCKCVLKSTCADHWCKCKMCRNMKVAKAPRFLTKTCSRTRRKTGATLGGYHRDLAARPVSLTSREPPT